ncbi:MAG: hypothetical protein ACT4P6_07275 [Gemmatimonadaceae bacterium]
MLALTAVAAAASDSLGQGAAAPQLTGVISTNPLGFLQLGPNLEYELAVNNASALGVGVRLPSLGVMSHIINDGIQGGWTVYGIWHAYPKGTRLRRWFIGPHIELGRTDNESFKSNIFGAGGEFGHRWVKPNGFAIAVGGLLGILKSKDTWKDGSGSAGDETYVLWMLNVSLGIAR